MKRRQIWKKQEAVSPVIATILMVAITVVLAATLYMMLPGGDETGTLLSGRISVRSAGTQFQGVVGSPATIQVEFSLSAPRSVAQNRITVDILDANGEDVADIVPEYSLTDDDDRVVTGSRMTLTFGEGDNVRGYEIIVRIDGYDGTMSTVAQ